MQGRKCPKQDLYVNKQLSTKNLGFWQQRDLVEINLPEKLYFWTNYLDCDSQSPHLCKMWVIAFAHFMGLL